MHYNKILYSPYCVIPQPERPRAAYFRRYYEANKERYAATARRRYEEKCRAKFGAAVVVRKNNSRK
jgi:hypothetical protein